MSISIARKMRICLRMKIEKLCMSAMKDMNVSSYDAKVYHKWNGHTSIRSELCNETKEKSSH
jgi:hypothetical protein